MAICFSYLSAQKKQFLLLGAVPPLTKLANGHISTPGHAFVGFGIQSQLGEDSILYFQGNHPQEPLWKNVLQNIGNKGEVHGYLNHDDGFYAAAPNALMIKYRVSETEFQKAMAISQKWREQKLFQVNKKDCVSYLAEISKDALGLKTIKRYPFVNLLPITYLRKLIGKNSGLETKRYYYQPPKEIQPFFIAF